MKRYLFLLILTIACIVTACGTTNTAIPTSPIPQTQVSSPTPAPVRQEHFRIGQTVEIGDWQVAVVSLSVSQGSEFIRPDTGKRFLVIAVRLKNTSAEEQDLSTDLQFTFRDANGFQYYEAYLDTAKPSPGGKIEVGGLASGDLVYEVPDAMHTFTLAFESTLFHSGQAIWDITA